MTSSSPPLSSAARRAVFSSLAAEPRVDAVVRRIGDAIVLGLLGDGEQLPGESELSARLGVATVTLREALVVLRQQGLVTTRRGRGGGTFVRAPEDTLDDRLGARLLTHPTEELRDLADHWAALAGATARLAAERADAHDLDAPRRSLREFAEAEDPAARGRLDGRFHVEIAAAAQSARLTREEIRFQTEIGPLLCLAFNQPEAHREADAQHRALVDAVASGDGTRARDLAEQHVHFGLRRLIERRLDGSWQQQSEAAPPS
ncbi:FadR/GntR family transcriptional regulator [Streptacidiphilus jiangxiensis]|uniref:DNA-binding transcriptional regulator, FadR family n=1 Tax=Streptacidiphilus jiangxiensis TaxID=235985 RepID=A0A1H7FNS8_STRJI|nr:FCD domain-containing protein [Streptacidiphilus jiangxiensis]SEK25025.1 DNA-binding transcriptional regulator, FadR family [Streptacidiphilus jiangxiensis]